MRISITSIYLYGNLNSRATLWQCNLIGEQKFGKTKVGGCTPANAILNSISMPYQEDIGSWGILL